MDLISLLCVVYIIEMKYYSFYIYFGSINFHKFSHV